SIAVETIKTTGEFPATVALHPEISASFTVKVVAE
ncbi:50S ribosomal L9 C-terminal domain-containing protein, partial [Bifidobacterium tibiigranuli]